MEVLKKAQKQIQLELLRMPISQTNTELSYYVCPNEDGSDPHILFPAGSQLIVNTTITPYLDCYVVVQKNHQYTTIYRWSDKPINSPIIQIINSIAGHAKVLPYYSYQNLVGVIVKKIFPTQ